ncbi:MAG: branched-chain amino acid transaminase [Chloroflexaceae bacterium]|nr:branched-chain amino acid transaminase [Chloroflexaceae bacterium]NJL34269.1 branched-chain amino acid transaminase [Chloroflexaceae bacterium]NJO06381.1 branched-chain amino acid transaminase [Chloroflexaceae bacterium]
MKATPYIWFRGELVDWSSATVHVMSHAIHYGSSIFEGIRAYDTPRGPAIFRLTDHLRRLFDSAKIYRIPMPYTLEQLTSATKQVVQVNKLRSAYIRPVAFYGYGTLGIDPSACPTEVAIGAFEMGSYLGPESLEQGVDVGVSSWQRFAPNTLPALAKAGGNYLSSQLMNIESRRHGYAEAIALDTNGLVSEGGGENLFLVREGTVITPPLTAAILGGITRDSVVKLLAEQGIAVKEQPVPRELLYIADEVFFTGTAAEIVPIRSIDGITIGNGRCGPLTAQVQHAFFGTVQGEREDTYGWLEYVES